MPGPAGTEGKYLLHKMPLKGNQFRFRGWKFFMQSFLHACGTLFLQKYCLEHWQQTLAVIPLSEKDT